MLSPSNWNLVQSLSVTEPLPFSAVPPAEASGPQFPPWGKNWPVYSSLLSGLGPSLDLGSPARCQIQVRCHAQWLHLGWRANEGAPDSPKDLTCLFSGNATSGSEPCPSLHHLPSLSTHHQHVCPWQIAFLISLLLFWKDAIGAADPTFFLFLFFWDLCPRPQGNLMSTRLRMWHHRQFRARSSPLSLGYLHK